MGFILSRPAQTPDHNPPVFRNVFTDLGATLGHSHREPCLSYNLRWVDCMEAYGSAMGKTKCSELFQDYQECRQEWKQLERVAVMRNERERQWLMGVLGYGERREKDDIDAPSYDTFLPDFDLEDP